MTRDSINDEIRTIRRQLAGRCGNDLAAILKDVRQREASDGRTYAELPSRRITAAIAGQPDPAELAKTREPGTKTSPLAQ